MAGASEAGSKVWDWSWSPCFGSLKVAWRTLLSSTLYYLISTYTRLLWKKLNKDTMRFMVFVALPLDLEPDLSWWTGGLRKRVCSRYSSCCVNPSHRTPEPNARFSRGSRSSTNFQVLSLVLRFFLLSILYVNVCTLYGKTKFKSMTLFGGDHPFLPFHLLVIQSRVFFRRWGFPPLTSVLFWKKNNTGSDQTSNSL